MGFHALDSDIFAGLGGLGLEHFGESTLAFLADQSVLCNSEQTISVSDLNNRDAGGPFFNQK